MELRVLRYFVTVADEKNISRAAKALRLTQPTLSRQLHDLEEELGMTLFERGARRITLTPQGELLYRRSREILALSDALKEEITSLDQDLGGRLSIGYSVPVVSRLLAEFWQSCPKVTVSLHDLEAEDIESRLLKGTLDFGFTDIPLDHEDLETVELSESVQLLLCMNREDGLAGELYIDPEEVKDRAVLLFEEDTYEKAYASWLGGEVACQGRVSDRLEALRLVSDCPGTLALFADEGTLSGLSDLVLRPFRPGIMLPAYVSWKKGSAARAVLAFQSFLHQKT